MESNPLDAGEGGCGINLASLSRRLPRSELCWLSRFFCCLVVGKKKHKEKWEGNSNNSSHRQCIHFCHYPILICLLVKQNVVIRNTDLDPAVNCQPHSQALLNPRPITKNLQNIRCMHACMLGSVSISNINFVVHVNQDGPFISLNLTVI